ncbi:unnamed protein product [Macrosiphum euphorbiae]|uniref:Uncharacterized protein n=1 Tax=Macrosiphum euphorbiae TaxID=13131 RepID=A0AAV0WM75_9HEMI|nr:unnamed protein product [Macrosiphum euphorbiae]
MLLSIKLNQLPNNIGIKNPFKRSKSTNEAKNQKKIEEMAGICETLDDYYKQYTLTTEFTTTTEGKGLKRHLSGEKKRHITQNCGDSNDYNAFTTFSKKKNVLKTSGGCDLIKPKIPSVPDHNINKKEQRNKFSKILTSYLKKRVKKHEAIKEPKVKEKDALKFKKKIKWYYSIFCNKVMPHYNLFYIFYTKYSKAKESKGHTTTASCDYFERIPENKING